jgi:hypothetical protein
MANIWRSDQHTVWEINWPAAPVGGPLTVESWRSGDRYRFEILEATPPALRGEVLVFDGQSAWRYNRFDPPAVFNPTSPALPPVSEAFRMVDRLLSRPAKAASQEIVYLNYTLTQKSQLSFMNGDTLTFWSDRQTRLPVQIHFSVAGQQALFKARESEPLTTPPEGLFGVGEWIQNLP